MVPLSYPFPPYLLKALYSFLVPALLCPPDPIPVCPLSDEVHVAVVIFPEIKDNRSPCPGEASASDFCLWTFAPCLI